MTAFPPKYESPVNPRSAWTSVNSLFFRCWEHGRLSIAIIFMSCKGEIPPALPVYHPKNSFNINLDVLENAGITSGESILMKTQLCWAGHVFRMPDHCLDHTIRRTLDRSPQQRQDKQGTQCLQHWPQTLDYSKAADRIAWLCSVRQGTISFGANWRATL